MNMGLTVCGEHPGDQGGRQSSHKGAHALQAFNGQVGHAAALAVDAADGHDKQGEGKGEAINDNGIQIGHAWASFPSVPAASFLASPSRWRPRFTR